MIICHVFANVIRQRNLNLIMLVSLVVVSVFFLFNLITCALIYMVRLVQSRQMVVYAIGLLSISQFWLLVRGIKNLDVVELFPYDTIVDYFALCILMLYTMLMQVTILKKFAVLSKRLTPKLLTTIQTATIFLFLITVVPYFEPAYYENEATRPVWHKQVN